MNLKTSPTRRYRETWALFVDSEENDPGFRNQVPEETSLYRLLGEQDDVSVRDKINFLVSPLEPLLATVKRRKLTWFLGVTRLDSLSKTILKGALEEGRHRGRQRKC